MLPVLNVSTGDIPASISNVFTDSLFVHDVISLLHEITSLQTTCEDV